MNQMKQLFRDVDSDDEMFIQLDKAAKESDSNLTPRMMTNSSRVCIAGGEEGHTAKAKKIINLRN